MVKFVERVVPALSIFILMRHVLFKVIEEKQNDWRSWCDYLCKHRKEAEETMREERCVYERSVMYECDDSHYVVGTIEFNGEPKKANLSIKLNAQHQKTKKDCLGKVIGVFEGHFKLPPVYEVLYEFDLR